MNKEEIVSEAYRPILQILKLAMQVFLFLFIALQLIITICCSRDIYLLTAIPGIIYLIIFYLIMGVVKANIKRIKNS